MFLQFFRHVIVWGALLGLPHLALAVSCKEASTWNARQVIALDQDVYVSTADIVPGKLLWRSQNYTVTFRCVDSENYPSGEDVFFYWDPARSLTRIHDSIEVGVTYQSIDYRPVYGQQRRIGQGTAPPPRRSYCTMYWNRSRADECARSLEVTVTFSVYIKATGMPPPSNGQINENGAFDLFQIDGVNGLNSTPNSNYRAAISGLGRIHFIACNPQINVRANGGNAVDFGRIPSNTARPGDIARAVPFSVEVNMSGPNAGNQCEGKALVGSFSTSHPVEDRTVILPESDSGFGIVLSDAANPAIPMRTAVPLGVVNGSVVQHEFVASLKWLSDHPKIGPFQATATIDVSFR
ncbi:fimbrial protein [Allopusillimonas soli]|uniref:Fimbrial protein n=1 Tax=Allopusillimonas soli TaxID=659016 RepID=A0A853FDB0_9BURK|nr:fimbrial protein [Allopusillimonas soli]NYT37718.1 fimbrial protein [Allopusillimonas soli]TEA74336.1 fimbrial protein [Allopusillimonas soli]